MNRNNIFSFKFHGNMMVAALKCFSKRRKFVQPCDALPAHHGSALHGAVRLADAIRSMKTSPFRLGRRADILSACSPTNTVITTVEEMEATRL